MSILPQADRSNFTQVSQSHDNHSLFWPGGIFKLKQGLSERSWTVAISGDDQHLTHIEVGREALSEQRQNFLSCAEHPAGRCGERARLRLAVVQFG